MNYWSRKPEVAIVVPCYNERERLEVAKFLDFARRFPHVTFVMVDDGSHDGTDQILQSLHTAVPQQFVVKTLSENRGKAEAVRQGLLYAVDADYEFVGFWDADLATPLEAIENFTETLRRNSSLQVVIGCRLPLLGHQIERNPGRARLGGLFALAASKVLGSRFRDTQCGAKLFRRTPEFISTLNQPFDSSWIFDVELLARLKLMQPEHRSVSSWVYELPLESWFEIPGSKLRMHHFFKAALELVTIYRNYRGKRGASFRALQQEWLFQSTESLKFPSTNRVEKSVPATRRKAA